MDSEAALELGKPQLPLYHCRYRSFKLHRLKRNLDHCLYHSRKLRDVACDCEEDCWHWISTVVTAQRAAAITGDDRIGCMLQRHLRRLLWFPSRVNFDLTAYIDRHAMFSSCILSKLAFRIPSVILQKQLLGLHSRLHIAPLCFLIHGRLIGSN